MAQTQNECQQHRDDIVTMIKVNSDLSVISTFANVHQVAGYVAYKENENLKLKIENQKLMIVKGWKTLTKVATLISTMAGAVLVVLELII